MARGRCDKARDLFRIILDHRELILRIFRIYAQKSSAAQAVSARPFRIQNRRDCPISRMETASADSPENRVSAILQMATR